MGWRAVGTAFELQAVKSPVVLPEGFRFAFYQLDRGWHKAIFVLSQLVKKAFIVINLITKKALFAIVAQSCLNMARPFSEALLNTILSGWWGLVAGVKAHNM